MNFIETIKELESIPNCKIIGNPLLGSEEFLLLGNTPIEFTVTKIKDKKFLSSKDYTKMIKFWLTSYPILQDNKQCSEFKSLEIRTKHPNLNLIQLCVDFKLNHTSYADCTFSFSLGKLVFNNCIMISTEYSEYEGSDSPNKRKNEYPYSYSICISPSNIQKELT